MSKMQKYKMKRLMDDSPKAILHEAKNVKKDEMIIIKELKKKYYTQEDCNSNREVQVQNKMKHENVLKMLEMFNDDTELLMVFEHMPENLRRLMKRRDKPFSEPEAKGIMSQLLSAVSFIHKQGYIHCNLKPENLMCNDEGSVVKVTDFSTAKCLLDAPFGDLNVQPSWYKAPEVLLGSENYSTPIDIWSAGCIMAELLAGKPLLKGDSDHTQMLKICEFLGTFTRSEWPEGISLLFNINYNLPKNSKVQGFSNIGFEGSSDAKEVILSMLKWCPQKRKTADQCLLDPYFQGSIDCSPEASQEFQLQTLESWKNRWEHNIASESLEEFDIILRQLATSRQPQNGEKMRYHQNNPLLGDTTPRGGMVVEKDNRDGGRMDEIGRSGPDNKIYLELTRRNDYDTPRNYLETERGNNMDTQRNNLEMPWNNVQAHRNNMEPQRTSSDEPIHNLEEEVIARQERRARQNIANNDMMFTDYFGENPGNDRGTNQSQNQGQGQSRDQGQGQGQAQPQEEEHKYNARGLPLMSRADRLKRDTPWKYETIYGKGLNYVLGGHGVDGRETDIYGNTNQGNFGGQQKTPGNNRRKLGNKPPGSVKLPDKEGDDAKLAKSKYTPTWAEKGKSGRGGGK